MNPVTSFLVPRVSDEKCAGDQGKHAEKAALAITNYREAIDRVAQTSLREMIGSSMLAALLLDRKEADEQLKVEIGRKTAPWRATPCRGIGNNHVT
jgi:regulator of protease activity HflC (stomatin/prohibitin superfamily)